MKKYLVLVCLIFISMNAFAIVEGQPANISDWQAIASIRSTSSNQHKCGASLVASNAVLTAAHCIYGYDKADFRVYIASENKYYDIQDVVQHPNYDSGFSTYDLVLIFLVGSSSKTPIPIRTYTNAGGA
jgi:V8-like Glu-specific endopeptidase